LKVSFVRDRETDNQATALKLVSENADRDIDIVHAKQRVTRQLANLASSILRTIAGSPSAAPIMPSVLGLVDAQKKLAALSGSLLAPQDERQALSLVEASLPPGASDTRYRQFEHALGIETIVKGALRVAGHQLLKEREPFGGKYATRAIEQGIATVVRASSGPPIQKRNRRKTIL
jgi:hypothetical protein